MQLTIQKGVADPKVIRVRDVRGMIRARRDASDQKIRQLDQEIAALKAQRRKELFLQEGYSTLLGEVIDDRTLAEKMQRIAGWQIDWQD